MSQTQKNPTSKTAVKTAAKTAAKPASKTSAKTETPAPRRRQGLGASLAGSLVAGMQEHQAAIDEAGDSQTMVWTARPIDLTSIDPNPYQPRIRFIGIEELAQLIDEQGLQQPITVRPYGNRYQIVSGERRVRAHRHLGKTVILAHVKNITEEEMSALALAENLGREDLTDFELARSLLKHKSKFGSSVGTHAEFGLTKTVYYRLMAFENLPEAVNTLLEKKPELISGLTAENTVKVIKKRVEEGIELDQVHKALISIVQKAITSNTPLKNLASTLEAKFNQSGLKITPQAIESNGVTMGQVKTTKTHFELKLKRTSFTEEQLKQIEEFVKNLKTA